jgi:CRP-like cAMP-binding protein
LYVTLTRAFGSPSAVSSFGAMARSVTQQSERSHDRKKGPEALRRRLGRITLANARLRCEATGMTGANLDLLLKRIELRMPLNEAQKHSLREAVERVQNFEKGIDLVREGDRVGQSILLLSGYAIRYQQLEDGGRQITAIHVPGDFVDLHSFPLKVMDHTVGALTDCSVAIFPHAALLKITETDPYLTRALWMLTLLDSAIHREWIVAIGAKDAAAHTAHLFCELFARLKFVGLTQGHRFSFPITQAELGDALGISTVHVNRVLQGLRGDNLIEFDGRTLSILNWPRFADLAGFDGRFLHLNLERDVDLAEGLA